MIDRRAFLQTIIGVPLAVKAYVSTTSITSVKTLLEPLTDWSENSHDWFNFTVEIYQPTFEWGDSATSAVVTERIGAAEYTVKASCYGWREDLNAAFNADRPVLVQIPEVGEFNVRLNSIAFNAGGADAPTTDITGRIEA